jgi:hypothetical protein
VFFEFLTPFTLGVCNFLISNPLSTIASVSAAPSGGVQVLVYTRSKGALPLDLACPELLSVWSPADP